MTAHDVQGTTQDVADRECRGNHAYSDVPSKSSAK